MDDNDKKDPRSRDDSRLRHQLENFGKWMAEQGVENLPMDWEAVAREKRAERLIWRISEAFRQLAGAAGLSADQVRRIEEMALAPPLASAALGIELNAEDNTSEIRGEPDAMRNGSGLQVAPATPAERLKSGVAEDSPIRIVSFVSPEFRGARVHVDAGHGLILVEMQAEQPEPLVLLIPEDAGQPAQLGVFQREGRRARVIFENVGGGSYLLTVHTPAA